jgi:hypothetical protein
MKHTSFMLMQCGFIVCGGHHEGGLLNVQCIVLDNQQNYQKPYAANFGLG